MRGSKSFLRAQAQNLARRLALALRDARARDLDAVDADLVEQHLGELELLGGGVGDLRRLLAVSERRVHHLDALARGGHRELHQQGGRA